MTSMARTTLVAVLVVLAAAAAVAAAPANSRRVALEEVPEVPPGFTQGDRAPAERELDLLVFVRHADADSQALHAVCQAVSDPLGERYGKYLTAAQLEHEVIRAHANRAEVERWLAASGVTRVERRGLGDMLRVRLTVREAEALLMTEFYEFAHDATGHVWTRARAYTVPAEVAPYVSLIGGVVTLVRPAKKGVFPTDELRARASARAATKARAAAIATQQSGVEVATEDNPTIYPALLHQYYAVPTPSASSAAAGNSASVAEFPYGGVKVADEYYEADSLAAFLTYAGIDPAKQPVHTSGDPNLPQDCILGQGDNCGESMLDIEVLVGVAAGFVPQGGFDFRITNSGNATLEHFLEWAEALASLPDGELPLVHSVSFGDPEYSFSPQYLDQVNAQLCAVAARGASVFVASGDCGVSDSCLFKDCNAPLPVDFPASATYAVGVGGTQITSKGEIVCSIDTGAFITSGGGFSSHFAQLPFEAEFTQAYLTSGVALPPPAYFNASMAGSPTISFVAHNFFTVVNGHNASGVDGTSASTPTAAGMFTVINAHRLAAGKPPVGWVKPILYHIASLKLDPSPFNDVTVGNNKAGEGEFECDYGYNAAPSWDPATGFGSFSVELMIKALDSVDQQREELLARKRERVQA